MSTTMTTWGHACVRLEKDGRVLVVDPGAWSDLSVLDGADAVLVTHGHPDHLAADAVAAAMGAADGLVVRAPADALGALLDAGAPSDRVHAVSAGDRFDAAGFAVEVLGGTHAEVHPDVEVPQNVGYLVDGGVLHPGDWVRPLGPTGVDVLCVPVGGPWLRVSDAVDLVRAVRPATVVPIHDAVLSEQGRGLVDRLVGGLGGAGYRRLAAGETLTVG